MKAHSARMSVLAGATVVALATGGFAYGASAGHHDGRSTTGMHAAPGVSGQKAPVAGTAKIHPQQGVKPSGKAPTGATANLGSPARTFHSTGKSAPADKSDKGKKGLKATKDKGKKGLKQKREH